MRQALKLGEVNPLPILHALALKPELWNQYDLRSTYPGSPHAEVDDILCRFNEIDDAATMVDDLVCVPYPAWSELPVKPAVFDLMRLVEGVGLGRVMITKLKPGGRIAPHVDQGAPAEYYRRYQFSLQSLPGATFRFDNEVVSFRSGEVWWINNRVEHEVINGSEDDRIVMIADIRLAADE